MLFISISSVVNMNHFSCTFWADTSNLQKKQVSDAGYKVKPKEDQWPWHIPQKSCFRPKRVVVELTSKSAARNSQTTDITNLDLPFENIFEKWLQGQTFQYVYKMVLD